MLVKNCVLARWKKPLRLDFVQLVCGVLNCNPSTLGERDALLECDEKC